MEHNWDTYVDTTNPLWDKLQEIYKENDNYPKVITKNRNLHHKFLRSFSRAEGTEIDNDNDNLVSLGLGDHFLAHWILWKISKAGWRRYTARACTLMYKRSLKYLTIDAAESIAVEWNAMCRDLVGKRNSGSFEKGHIPWIKGKCHSEEAKERNRQAHLGKIQSEETKRKISEALKGRPLGPCKEEHKRKISEAKKGRTSTLKGIPRSEETKRKISEANKGKMMGKDNPRFIHHFTEEEIEDVKLMSKVKWRKKYHHGENVYHRLLSMITIKEVNAL